MSALGSDWAILQKSLPKLGLFMPSQSSSPGRLLQPVPASDGSHIPSKRSVQHRQQGVAGTKTGGNIGWKTYCTASFPTAMAVVMAELSRQVEVQCSERAQALALTWNLYSASMDACVGQLAACAYEVTPRGPNAHEDISATVSTFGSWRDALACAAAHQTAS